MRNVASGRDRRHRALVMAAVAVTVLGLVVLGAAYPSQSARAVDPSPTPAPTVPPGGWVPGVNCVQYPLFGSDIPACPSPSPSPSPTPLCDPAGILGPVCPTITPAPVYGSPAPDPLLSSTTCLDDAPDIGNGAAHQCRWDWEPYIGHDRAKNVNGSVLYAASGFFVPEGTVVTFTFHVISYGVCVTGGPYSVTAGFLRNGGGDPVPGYTTSPAGGQYCFDTWTTTAAYTAQHNWDPSAGAYGDRLGPQVIWSYGGTGGQHVRGEFYMTALSGPGFQLDPLPTGALITPSPTASPPADCVKYPLVGSDAPTCPPEQPVDCVQYPLIGSDAPVCPREQTVAALSPITRCAKPGVQNYALLPSCPFPGFSLDLGQYAAWLGCLVSWIGTIVGNGFLFLVNVLVDIVVPCPGTADAAIHRWVDAFGTSGPFGQVRSVVQAIQSGLAGTGPGVPFQSLTVMGKTVTIDYMGVANAAAPIRPFLLPILGLTVALRYLGMVGRAVKMGDPSGKGG